MKTIPKGALLGLAFHTLVFGVLFAFESLAHGSLFGLSSMKLVRWLDWPIYLAMDHSLVEGALSSHLVPMTWCPAWHLLLGGIIYGLFGGAIAWMVGRFQGVGKG